MGVVEKTQSLLFKIMLLILSVTLMSTTVMGWLNYTQAREVMIKSLQENGQSQVNIHAAQLGTWLQTRMSEIEVIANTDVVRFGEQQDILKYFNDEFERFDGIYYTIGISDTAGNLTVQDGETIQISSEATFSEVMEGNSVISNPFPDKIDPNYLIISFEAPVYDENRRVKGLVSGASFINKVFEEATDFKIGKTDTVYVFQDDGLIIHHPDKEKVLQENLLESASPEMTELTEEMLHDQQGFAQKRINGEERIIFYSVIPNSSWIMALDLPVKEFVAELNNLLITTIISGVLALILNGMILYVLVRQMIRRIRKVADTAEKIAEGQLSVEKIVDTNNDEVSHLANAVNRMAYNLRHLLIQVQEAMQSVTAASSRFVQGVQHASYATETITQSALEVSSATEQQFASIQHNVSALEQITMGIQKVASTSSDLSETAMKTEQEAVQGNQQIIHAVEHMDEIYQSMQQLAQAIEGLANRSKEIVDISAMITDLSEQTNLLALNAAIEAARAGENGKGFAVVANEVRKLAEESKQSADQISNLIHEIQVETEKTVDTMKAGGDNVHRGIAIVHQAGDMFNNILESIKHVTEQIQAMSAYAQQISASTEDIQDASSEMLTIAQNSAENASTVTEQSDIQLQVIEDIKHSTDTLNNMVKKLQETMNQFSL